MIEKPPTAVTNISRLLARAIIFFNRFRLLRPVAIYLASIHMNYHGRLVDARAKREKEGRDLGWWWLSFVDPDRPAGERFQGVAIVQGHGVASASIQAHNLGINPGGAVQAVELTGDDIPSPALRNRLLGATELKEAGLI